MSDFKRYDVEMSGHFQELVERDNGDLMNFDDHDSIAISLHGQIAQLKADKALLRESLLALVGCSLSLSEGDDNYNGGRSAEKLRDDEELSDEIINAENALVATEDTQCHTQK
jgi:hypothetical protein